jgi:hypothetical protein
LKNPFIALGEIQGQVTRIHSPKYNARYRGKSFWVYHQGAFCVYNAIQPWWFLGWTLVISAKVNLLVLIKGDIYDIIYPYPKEH